MIRRPAILALAVATLAFLPAVRALGLPLDDNDTNRKDAECFIDKDDVLSPGLSLSPSSGTAVTPAPGVIECHGKVNGAAPTGDGQVTEFARYGTKDPDTCTSGGEGDGKLDISIPTSAGKSVMGERSLHTVALDHALPALDRRDKVRESRRLGERLRRLSQEREVCGACQCEAIGHASPALQE